MTTPARRTVPGFPKKLPCLICGRPRRSSWPGDRIHPTCQKEREQQAVGEYLILTNTNLEET